MPRNITKSTKKNSDKKETVPNRFDAKRVFYFYPESSDNEDRDLWLNQGSSFEDDVTARKDICLTKHGLIITQDADSYKEFKEQISVSESRFVEVFK